MQQHVGRIWVTILLLGSLASYVYFIPSLLGYGLTGIAYGAFIIYYFGSSEAQLRVELHTYLIGVIFVLYAIHLYLGVVTGTSSPGSVLRVLVFVPLFFANVFLIPRVTSLQELLGIMARLGAVLVTIGLFVVTLGPINLGLFVLEPSRGNAIIPMIGQVPMMKSVLLNPNQLAIVTVFGAIGALIEVFQRKHRYSIILLCMNIGGLYLTTARGSIGTLVMIISILIFYRVTGNVSIVGTASIAGVILVIGSFLLATGGYISIPVETGRFELWAGSFEALKHHPVIGFGPGDTGKYILPYVSGHVVGSHAHNSYIRLFLTTGLIGGVCYILFIVITIKNQFGRAVSGQEYEVILFALLVGLSFNQFFEAYSLFGTSITSTLPSIMFGFAVNRL